MPLRWVVLRYSEAQTEPTSSSKEDEEGMIMPNLLSGTVDYAGGVSDVLFQRSRTLGNPVQQHLRRPSPVPIRHATPAMRRRSSSCMVIKRLERCRNAAVLSSTFFSSSTALSRMACSTSLLSWMSEQVPYHRVT